MKKLTNVILAVCIILVTTAAESSSCFGGNLRTHKFNMLPKQHVEDLPSIPDSGLKDPDKKDPDKKGLTFKNKFLQEIYDKLTSGDKSAATTTFNNGTQLVSPIEELASELASGNDTQSNLFTLFDLLISNGADVNDNSGTSLPICIYIDKSKTIDVNVLKKFKDSGCDFFLKNGSSLPASDRLINKRDKDAMLYFLDNCIPTSKYTPYVYTSTAGNKTVIHKIIQNVYDSAVFNKVMGIVKNQTSSQPKDYKLDVFLSNNIATSIHKQIQTKDFQTSENYHLCVKSSP